MILVIRRTLVAALALACLSCAGAPRGADSSPRKAGPPMPEKTADLPPVDHVLLGIGDLQRGIDELERRTGVRAVFGGAHPGRGTQNALIALGGEHYLEILAPNPAEAANPDAAELHALQTLTPIGWAARSHDLAALRQSLQGQGIAVEAIRPGGRNLPDGSRLSWQTLGFTPPASPLLPFFIQWGEGSAHPSATSPQGCRLVSLILEDPAPDSLRKTLRAAGLGVEVRQGKEARIHLSLACPKGRVEFP
jgi:hypothetical protein